jgi:hypothetical protein
MNIGATLRFVLLFLLGMLLGLLLWSFASWPGFFFFQIFKSPHRAG